MFSFSPATPATFLLFVLCQLHIFINVTASRGDRAFIFNKCLNSCRKLCPDVAIAKNQSLYMDLLSWPCPDECRYHCMWRTVRAFHRDGSDTPQFYGKWPFVRFAGIQEPASMIFSLLNAVSHLAIFYYRSKVPPSTPMYVVWHGMAVVGIVTWLCAAIFHTRDTPITEKMDYFSAFALILYNVFSMLCRVIGTSHRAIIAAISVLLIGLYAYHIHYMAFVKFDYGYNMTVLVTIGVLNGLGWTLWSLYYWKTRPYVKTCFFNMLGINALLLLELGDFPPILWTFDAHAIWHGGTVILNLFWYRFIIDDALYKTPPTAESALKKSA